MRYRFFAGDVEAGRGTLLPPLNNMVSFAIVEVGNPQNFFYVELKLVFPEWWEARTEGIHHLTPAYLERFGKDPHEAMEQSAIWVRETAGDDIPIYCAMPTAFDYGNMDWYYRFTGVPSPFSRALDGREQYRILHRLPTYTKVKRRRIWREFPTSIPHIHHALSDSFEYEEVVAGMLRAQGLL
ncbi:MAG TPA: hypothetical protein VJ553_00410 [Candidatus Paceibacterota bacterium]|nr:hypothetical protein [Candidatus Paceibacterota bacterium]